MFLLRHFISACFLINLRKEYEALAKFAFIYCQNKAFVVNFKSGFTATLVIMHFDTRDVFLENTIFFPRETKKPFDVNHIILVWTNTFVCQGRHTVLVSFVTSL